MHAIEDKQRVLFVCPFYTAIREQHSFLSDGICLFLERNADQMSGAARYIHVCFHARMCNESHLAAHPELEVILIY